MGMNVVCPDCGHSEPSSNRRGARIGFCPKCGTQMRAHTAGKAKGRYICPIAGGVHTHGLGRTVQLAEPMRLVFVPGWDDNRDEPDPDRPGRNRSVRYHRDTPGTYEREDLDRAAGRVFGPGCVVSGGYQPPPPGDQWHGRAGVYLVPAPDSDPATWFVNEPVSYKRCAACPKKVVATDKTRMDREWVPAQQSYWAGSGWSMRRVEVDQGPHPAGTYACPDCRPTATSPAPVPEHAASTPATSPASAVTPAGAPAGQPETTGRVTADGTQDQGHAHAAIHEAVARLAGVCDFAESLDGQGFNATDTWLGHVLAAMPVSAWTEDEALAAWDMLRKYRGQLDGFGIGYDELPRPQGAGELEAARREQARERARQRGRQWREQQYRKANSYVRCDGAGEKVTLAFPFNPSMVDQAKKIKGRYFDWDTKTNVYPFTSLPQIVAFAEANGIDMAAEVRALVPASAMQAEQEAARANVYTDQAGRVVISAEHNPALNEALKALNGGRSTWDSRARVHRPPVDGDPGRVLEIAAEFGLTVGDDARAAIEGEKARQDRNQVAATAFEADPVPVPRLAGGLALKPQQYPVVRFALEHRQVLIGDDMGWGKTLSSLAAVAADGAYPAVVVCRPSLTLNWVAEIRRFFPALTVHEASGTTPQPVPDGADVIVIGSAALAAKPHTTKAGGKQFGWVTALVAARPKALIIDEGQDTKERAANRSQACQQLAEAVIAQDGLVLDLTGTAILNRPRELCQQLAILGRIGEFGGPKAFFWRYCLSEVNEWGASYTGARNLTELHERLLRWGIMIRRSDDTKLGLPPCREHVLRIPQAELDPAVMARYRQAEHDLLGYLAEQARQAAERLGTDPAHAAVQAAIRAQAAEHLVAINTLRQLAGHAKRGYVTAWVRQRLAAGEKIMVAAHHREVVDHYASQFGGLKLQGGQPVAGKEAAKAAFQQQPQERAPVIAVAIGAGGVGHTLTAAAIGIQAEQAWTPGETQQMKKRLHRIGQDRPVDYYITVAAGTIDEHLWEVVSAKQATLNAVLDGKTDEGVADDKNSVAAELTWRLTQQGLTGMPSSRPEPGQEEESPGGVAERGSQSTNPDGAAAAGVAGEAAEADPARGDGDLCPGCGTARLLAGRTMCQACGVLVAMGRLPLPSAPDSGSGRTVSSGQAGMRHPHHDGDAMGRFRSASDVAASDDDDEDAPPIAGGSRADELRRFAHHYLAHGLLPVPGWAAKANGQCCCPRGADCPRPGKHPRSVHVGPGERDYSWKPLACRTDEEIDLRFADGGAYADANLMLAIPTGMLVIDQDNDDGGRQAFAELAVQLGELPPTLTHRTPHGVHRIYRTPPGWTGRAWVGKDTRNPLPAGIDLRVPGQILMAPPSRVPRPGGTASYGPAAGTGVADLPAAYLTAWTPPQAQAVRPRRTVPVPPDRADLAASYVHGKVAGIIADLAAHEPGGRNAAVYTAALKVGSTLGAVRATPGAEHAAAEWTDQAAEDALMEAAERNGYIGKDGAAEARSAIRSGLRNGLRNPRPLPDFTARPDAPGHKTTEGSGRHWTGSAAPVARQAAATHAGQSPDGSRRAGQNRPAWVRQAPTQEALTADSVSEVLRAAGFVASSDARKAAHAPEGYQVQATPDGGILLSHMAIDEPVNGVSPSARKEQMLARYAHALQIAGIHVTSADGNSLAMKPPPVRPPAAVRADSERAGQIAASRAALAADEAYRAGEFDQARQLIDEAADLDPARTDLWQQHRIEIAAKRLSAQAREAAAEGDSGRADELIAEARQLDPRMQMLWHRHLAGVHSGQHAGQARGPATAGNDRNQNHSARQLARERTADARAAPQWPERSTFSHSSQTSSASEAHGPLPRPRKEPGVSTQPAAEEAKQQVSNGEAEQQPAARRPDAGLARREPESATRVPGAGHEQSISTPSLGPGLSDRPPTDPEGRGINGGDWRDALIEKERRDWQPKLAGAREVHPRAPQAEAPEIGA